MWYRLSRRYIIPPQEGEGFDFLKSAQIVTGLTKIWAGINNSIQELALASASLPSGLIAIWKGSTSTIPTGWVLCDGSNGTPDLRDKFVLGAGNSYGVGDTGGEETHTLTVDEIPNHTHDATYGIRTTLLNSSSTKIDGAGSYTNRSEYVYSANNSSKHYAYEFKYDSLVASAGGGQAHNNMPPYYALCYIMKI